MSSTNRGRLAYVEQQDCDVLPANPTLQVVRFTSSDLAYTKETTQSDELDSSGMTSDVPEVGASSGGGVNIEWSAGTYDDWIEAATRGRFGAAVAHSGNASIVAATRTLTATGAFTNAQPGQRLLLSGFVAGASYPGALDSPNNGWFEIESVTSANAVVLKDPAAKLVDETATAANVGGKCLVNGTDKRCFAFEESFLDTGSFLAFLAQRIGTMSMSLSTGSIATGSFGFQGSEVLDEQLPPAAIGSMTVDATARTLTMVGAFAGAVPGQTVTVSGMTNAGNNGAFVIESVTDADEVVITAASGGGLADEGPTANAMVDFSATEPSWLGTGTRTPATTNPVLNATSNVGQILIDGKVSKACFQSLDFNLDNNLRQVPCIGKKFPRVEYGKQDVSGSIQKAFVDLELWRAMRDHKDISLSFGFISPDRRHGIYVFIPRATLSSDQVDLSGGNNSDVSDNVDWTALRYTDAGGNSYHLQICVA